MWAIAKALFGGAWAFLRMLPWWLYLAAVVVFVGWRWHSGAVDAAYAEGGTAARQELSIPLMQAHALAAEHLAIASVYYQQASDAEGRALAFERGLNRCIGTRVAMDTITSAVLRMREQQRAAAVQQLSHTQQELSHAYDASADRCADQPVPAAVVRVLDAAAFGAPSATGPNADSGRAGAAVRAHSVVVDGSDPESVATGTTYRDLAGWIAEGWAGALRSCNSDKAGIASLRPDAAAMYTTAGPSGGVQNAGATTRGTSLATDFP
jgi:hypothetical protein